MSAGSAPAGPPHRRAPAAQTATERSTWVPVLLAAWFVWNLVLLQEDLRGAAGPAGGGAGFRWLLALPSALWLTLAGWQIVRAARRSTAPGEGARLWAVAGLVVAGAAVNVVLRQAIRGALDSYAPSLAPATDAAELLGTLAALAVLAAAAYAFEYARRSRERAIVALRLQTELATAEMERAAAELRVLKMQLNPHFLFNSLGAIGELVTRAPERAEQMVVRLSELLRHAMTGVARQEVALEEEIETLKPFLEVEQLRLGGGLRVEWDVDEEALDGLVPHMILQPLAENAAAGGGSLCIAARRAGDRLEVEVTGDGAGHRAPEQGPQTEASSPHARLRQLYGDDFLLELGPRAGGQGTLARLGIPWHEEARAPLPASLPDPRTDMPASRLAVAAGWGMLGATFLVLSGSTYQRLAAPGAAHLAAATPAQLLLASILNAFAWAYLLRRAFRTSLAQPLAASGWRAVVLPHLRGGGAAAALLVAVSLASRVLLVGWDARLSGRLAAESVRTFAVAAAVYALVAVVAQALEYARRYRLREVAELRLQARLARTELDRASSELRVLKLQLNPHFLFNSLNAVGGLVGVSPQRAERIVLRLSEFLRQAMSSVGRQEVELREEIDTLLPFLEIEQLRLDGALRVEWDVTEEALGAFVPHMVLQPLVENAVKHGIAPRGGTGRVAISARRSGEWLELEVADDGAGPQAAVAPRAGGGVGTSNTRARLRQLYGEAFSFELLPGHGGNGATARIRLPWHREPTHALQGAAR
ncbi:MAG TPA: histidine kinase [Longimicrobium sp.]